jgi:hypothetical protein
MAGETPVAFRPPQIPHGLACDQTRDGDYDYACEVVAVFN